MATEPSVAVHRSSATRGSLGRMQLWVCGTIVTAALSFVTSVAASPEKSESAQETPEVVVEGTRPALKRRVDAFVSEITRGASPPDTALPRWGEPVCPLVAGLPLEQGELVLQTISEAATSAGAPLGPRECRANLYVIATSQPRELLLSWSKRDRYLFGGGPPIGIGNGILFGGSSIQTAVRNNGGSKSAIDRFLNTPRPIRAWYNTKPQFGHRQDALLKVSMVYDLSSVIVIVDTGRLDGVSLGEVADYVAMVGLAKVDIDAELGAAPTILNLFTATGDAGSRQMTPWDRAFLKALYHATQGSRQQKSLIANRMLSDVAAR